MRSLVLFLPFWDAFQKGPLKCKPRMEVLRMQTLILCKWDLISQTNSHIESWFTSCVLFEGRVFRCIITGGDVTPRLSVRFALWWSSCSVLLGRHGAKKTEKDRQTDGQTDDDTRRAPKTRTQRHDWHTTWLTDRPTDRQIGCMNGSWNLTHSLACHAILHDVRCTVHVFNHCHHHHHSH